MRPGTTAGVCEDDDELRGVLRSALEREGMHVRATASGSEAVRWFTEEPPDVLVLDVGLPDADGRDGVAFCRELVERAGVVAIPTSVFYDDEDAGRDLVRFAFCKRREVIDAAARRLADAA